MKSIAIVGGPALWVLAWAGAAGGAPPNAISPEDIQALRAEIALLREELQDQKRHYDTRLSSLQAEVDRLRSDPGKRPEGRPPIESGPEDELDALIGELTQEGVMSEPKPGIVESAGRAFQNFNPDISVIGDFVGHYTNREGGAFDDEFLFREVEIGLSGSVDPYARADVFLAVGREDGSFEIDLEEGYVTFLALPYDLQPRIGRFRSGFGKTNPVHLHALPWVEYPLIVQNYFGEEGLAGDGVGVSWLVPNPWDRYIELTYEIINNDSSLFAGRETDDFVHMAHLKSFFDLSGASTLELGASFATAPNDGGHGGNRTMIEGLDATYKWRAPEAGLYKSFAWQTELLAAQADLIGGQETSWGLYSSATYQFARRWAVGARYDYSQMPFSSSLHEHGYSAYLTFVQSEFLFWRLGYLFTDRNFRIDGNADEHEVFLQCNFGLGPHRAHTY